MNDQRVVTVIVTHNRLEFLKEVVKTVTSQSLPVNKILIVNNGSTDGTKEWMDERPELVSIHQNNTGGAGGFYTGMQKAMELQPDWIWMMDDDVAPSKYCLEHLLNYSTISQCLLPIHLDRSGNVLQEERWIDPATARIGSLFNDSYQQGKKYWFTNIASFEGILIHRSLVEKIGFPDPRFFLMHDDLFYGLKASRITNICVVADAIMQKLPVLRSNDSLYRSLYYQFRNLWIIEAYLDQEWAGFTSYRKRRIMSAFFYEAYKIIRFSGYPSRIKALKVLWRSFNDYRNKISGAGF